MLNREGVPCFPSHEQCRPRPVQLQFWPLQVHLETPFDLQFVSSNPGLQTKVQVPFKWSHRTSPLRYPDGTFSQIGRTDSTAGRKSYLNSSPCSFCRASIAFSIMVVSPLSELEWTDSPFRGKHSNPFPTRWDGQRQIVSLLIRMQSASGAQFEESHDVTSLKVIQSDLYARLSYNFDQ